MSDIHHRHVLSNGCAVWIQRHKLHGIRKPSWSLVEMTGQGFTDAPIITPLASESEGLEKLAVILRADVLEEMI